MKILAFDLAEKVKGEVKSVEGFDKYQGPKAIIDIPNHGELEVWFNSEDPNCETLLVDLKDGYITGTVEDLAILLNQEEIPESEIKEYE